MTIPDDGSSRDTLPGIRLSEPGASSALPTQTPPAPAAMSVGVDDVLNVLVTSRDSGSICETVLSSASSTQTKPSPIATFPGAVPSGTSATGSPVSGSSAAAPAERLAVSSRVACTIVAPTTVATTISAAAPMPTERRFPNLRLKRRIAAERVADASAVGSSKFTSITLTASSRPLSRSVPRGSKRTPSMRRARETTVSLARISPGAARLHSRAARFSAPPR
jgi:hypothetical protein